jgi:hypothetical protein
MVYVIKWRWHHSRWSIIENYLHVVQTGSVVHSFSLFNGCLRHLPRGEETGAWNWPLTSNYCRRQENVASIHPIPHTSSWQVDEMCNELVTLWKKIMCHNRRYCPSISMEGLRNITQDLSPWIQYPGIYSNRQPIRYVSELLQLVLTCSVIRFG